MSHFKPYRNHTTGEIRMAVQVDWMNGMHIMHGGELVKYIDEAAGIVACETAECYSCVTAAFHDVQLMQPVYMGDVLRAVATVVHWSHTTYTVEVFLYRQALFNGEKNESLCAHAWATMVAINQDGMPMGVPALNFAEDDIEGEKRFQQAEEIIAASKKRRHQSQ